MVLFGTQEEANGAIWYPDGAFWYPDDAFWYPTLMSPGPNP